MDIDSSSNTTSLLVNEQERRSEIRKRNRTLVLTVFSIIIFVSLLTGGVITYLVRVQYLHDQQLYVQNSAIRHFCSIRSSYYLELSGYRCFALLSPSVDKITPFANHPNKIFLLSLEKSYDVLTRITAMRPETCLGLLSHAVNHVNESLGVIRAKTDLETLRYEDMRGMEVGMVTVLDELRACVNGTRKDGLKGEDEVNLMVYDVMDLMKYGKYFLLHCNRINEYFRFDLENGGESGRIVENFLQVSLFGSQYLVIVLLFWVFFRQ